MIVGVDASNLRAGGGLTHLSGLLGAADPRAQGVSRVRVWGPGDTLARLAPRPWLSLERVPALDRGLARRVLWQRRALPDLSRGCAVLFAPGGTLPPGAVPAVTMCRNMLPFEPREAWRFGPSATFARLQLLRALQLRAFARADGVIFLTEYARRAVGALLQAPPRRSVTIPHGVDDSLRDLSRHTRDIQQCTLESPLRLLYVSVISPYKHQGAVARAVALLRAEGLPLAVDFVGPAHDEAVARAFRGTLLALDPSGQALRWRGELRGEPLRAAWAEAEAAVFASSCENMPNILVEAMSAGLPVACSDRGPMPEVLGDAGRYFNPEDAPSIARALRALAADAALRASLGQRARERAGAFSWRRCAEETFGFLARVAGADAREGAPCAASPAP
ncbi:MAG: glycosyltransferase [Deltaproteobacteria bacterium]|nr:glycosyltransferase [Deltaproteobacteria bacterium]